MRILLSLILFFNIAFSLNVENNNTKLSHSYEQTIEREIDKSNLSINNDKQLDMSFYSFYEKSDFVVRIIIYILIAFSILTWSVLIGKTVYFWFVFNILRKDYQVLNKMVNLNENLPFQKRSFIKSLIDEAKDEIEKSTNYSIDTISRIKYRIQSKGAMFLARSKTYTPILATIGSSATFLGLFGTVWGIMNSFIAIASMSNPSLSAVAPGIAQALFTTALGLGVAIPAVLFYNYLARRSAKFSNELSEISTLIFVMAHRDLNKR